MPEIENNDLTGPATSDGGGSVVEAWDKKHGTYKDTITGTDQMGKLPQSQMPQGTDPKPFSIKGS